MSDERERSFRDLKELYHKYGPFGPNSAEDVPQGLRQFFYSEESDLHRYAATERVSYIIGRKGSGKTSFLHRKLRGKKSFALEFTASSIFGRMHTFVDLARDSGVKLFSDHVADIWETCFWHAVFGFIVDHETLGDANPDDLQIVWDYADFANFQLGESPDERVQNAVVLLEEQVLPRLLKMEFISAVNQLGTNGSRFRDAVKAASRIFEREEAAAYLLIDSLESLHKNIDALETVIDGLFAFVTRITRREPNFLRPRVSFPAELMRRVSTLSSNPAKDFAQRLELEWRGSELLALASSRLTLYQLVHARDPAIFNPAHGSFSDQGSLAAFLPASFSNRIGGTERAEAYILRHTQLLPRHLIILLNSIGRIAIDKDRFAMPSSCDDVSLRDGVTTGEGLVMDDIVGAFSQITPQLLKACERTFRSLPFIFDDGRLHEVYNQAGVFKLTGLEYEDYKDTLVWIGAIGKHTETSERYHHAEFVYTAGPSLTIGWQTSMCVHPLFAERFESIQEEGPDGVVLPVYPYGSRPDVDLFTRAFEKRRVVGGGS